jgi:ketosteroid isomerase-like protein
MVDAPCVTHLGLEPANYFPVEIVRCIYDAYDDGDHRTPVEYFHENVESYISDFVPWGGLRKGLKQITEALAALHQYVATTFEPFEIIEAGEHVIAVGDTVGFVHRTGRAFSIRTVHVWRFEAGKIVRFEDHLDREMVMAVLAAA